MKFKLSERLAYLAGVWKARASDEGVGIRGNSRMREIFLKLLLELKLARPEEIKWVEIENERGYEGRVYFYHTALREYLRELTNMPSDLMRKRNAISSAYTAGLFDAVGGVKNGVAYFARMSAEDEHMVARLGFNCIRVRGKLVIAKSQTKEFLDFVKPHLKFLSL